MLGRKIDWGGVARRGEGCLKHGEPFGIGSDSERSSSRNRRAIGRCYPNRKADAEGIQGAGIKEQMKLAFINTERLAVELQVCGFLSTLEILSKSALNSYLFIHFRQIDLRPRFEDATELEQICEDHNASTSSRGLVSNYILSDVIVRFVEGETGGG